MSQIKKAIELLEKEKANGCNPIKCPCCADWLDIADQVLTLLTKEQPLASDFTQRIHTEPYDPKWKHTVIIRTEDRDALCDRLDTFEAAIKELVGALEELLSEAFRETDRLTWASDLYKNAEAVLKKYKKG